MARAILAIAFTLALVTVTYAQAERHSGLWLKQQAESYEKFVAGGNKTGEPKVAGEAGTFMGFVDGIALSSSGTAFCLPDGTTLDQMYAVVAKWVHNNPEKWHIQSHLLVSQALTQAFPCTRGQRR